MSDYVIGRAQIKSLCDETPEEVLLDSASQPFLPIPLAIDVIEKEKKGGTRLPAVLKKIINEGFDNVVVIPLSPQGLFNAMSCQDFEGKYSNREGNPFEFATEASAYEYEGVWERSELLESLNNISWG